MYHKLLLCALAGAFLVACQALPGDESALTNGVSTRARLSETVDMGLDLAACRVDLEARRLDTGEIKDTVLPVRSGQLGLRSGDSGRLVLESLELAVDDIVIPAADLPGGELHLTNIRLALAEPMDAETTWSDGDAAATADLYADFVLSWSLVTENGETVPLTEQHITDVETALDVSAGAAGPITVTLNGQHAGRFLNPAGFFELSDLAVELHGSD